MGLTRKVVFTSPLAREVGFTSQLAREVGFTSPLAGEVGAQAPGGGKKMSRSLHREQAGAFIGNKQEPSSGARR